MKAKHIVLLLIPLNIMLAYFIYNSITSEIDFNKAAKIRINENVQKLKDLRQIQVKYKQTKGLFANNFQDLIYFLENDSITIIKAIGETPDSLTDLQAIELGVIERDTTYMLAKENVFDDAYIKSRDNNFPLNINNLINVPYTNETYSINAGMIEKSKVKVQVFEISTNYGAIFTGLDAKNRSYNLDDLLKVGSMEEASLNGNWGE
mgnify:CR=1 FL=1|tara:strand:- start:929 stop:1546 length:618 start_codon:yes stop_codon:yes gene_type:complete